MSVDQNHLADRAAMHRFFLDLPRMSREFQIWNVSPAAIKYASLSMPIFWRSFAGKTKRPVSSMDVGKD